jgi:hypothetical protein
VGTQRRADLREDLAERFIEALDLERSIARVEL